MGNGNDNVSSFKYPSRVTNPSSVASSEPYEHEGARFGKGAYRHAGLTDNLMGSSSQAHSVPQLRVMGYVFSGTKARANDRIVNAGPPNGFYHGK